MIALRDSAQEAFRVITNSQLDLAPLPKQVPIDWKMLETASDTIVISTDDGLMYLKVFKYEAPLTSLNFIKLTKINYFANNVFHRVVPNFVIQAGDQSQTGHGGPGYTIRREVAPIGFSKAGMVGMASSGKDTEGSQWFITHLPTPHLDTRYTVFGEIFAGTEVIDKVHQYDKIINIFQEVK
jgi:cyclophilin family peptidyl-prolyl cis-trans isomerase